MATNPLLIPTLNQAITDVVNLLNEFADDSLFTEKVRLVFGVDVSSQVFKALIADLPEIEVVGDEVLQGALGAFSTQTGKIYLSQGLVSGDTNKLEAILIEEIGHYVDAQINPVDTPGDEGEYFAKVVLNQPLTEAEITRLKTENDQAVVVIDGQQIQIEQMATNNLYFNITINDTQNTYSTYYAVIESSIQAAGSFWDNYIGGVNANLEVVVNFNNNIPKYLSKINYTYLTTSCPLPLASCLSSLGN